LDGTMHSSSAARAATPNSSAATNSSKVFIRSGAACRR
jgi:hypothetical protein